MEGIIGQTFRTPQWESLFLLWSRNSAKSSNIRLTLRVRPLGILSNKLSPKKMSSRANNSRRPSPVTWKKVTKELTSMRSARSEKQCSKATISLIWRGEGMNNLFNQSWFAMKERRHNLPNILLGGFKGPLENTRFTSTSGKPLLSWSKILLNPVILSQHCQAHPPLMTSACLMTLSMNSSFWSRSNFCCCVWVKWSAIFAFIIV